MDTNVATAEATADALLNAALSPTTAIPVAVPAPPANTVVNVVHQAPAAPLAATAPVVATVPAEPPAANEVLTKRLNQFMMVRQKIEEMRERHAAEMAPLSDAKTKLESALMELLNLAGTDSATVRGIATVYKGTESSATVADGEAFRHFVITQQAWDLVDWRANKTGVKKFIGETNTVPPGVNFTQAQRVGVRKNNSAAA
jgi:hypothetical protein